MSYPALLDISALKTELGIGGNATVYRHIKSDPHFPRPVKIGKLTRFIAAEVRQYIDHLAESRETRSEADPKAADLPKEKSASGMGPRVLPPGPKRRVPAQNSPGVA